MSISLNDSIAEQLESPPELTPFMPEVLADLWSLGANPDTIVRLVAPVMPPDARVLDLACGKGATAVTLARALGCRVLGLDGLPPFVKTAAAMAERYGVSHLCRFESCDIRTYAPEPGCYDAVILGAARTIFGSIQDCIGVLREMVKPGGLIVLDDGCRKDVVCCEEPDVADYPTLEACRKSLTAHGDTIIAEEEMSLDELRAENTYNNRVIQRRVAQLVERHPAHAALLCAYASRQIYECCLLETVYRCFLWVLRKGS